MHRHLLLGILLLEHRLLLLLGTLLLGLLTRLHHLLVELTLVLHCHAITAERLRLVPSLRRPALLRAVAVLIASLRSREAV